MFPTFGEAHFVGYPEVLLTQRELREWRDELRNREARRRPIGFTAVWPDEEDDT